MGHVIYTVGYAGWSPEELIGALASRGVEMIIDVRRYPRSKIGGFSAGELSAFVRSRGLEYVWLGELGALGSRGYGAGCARSKTFDSYVWRLVHEGDVVVALRRLREFAEAKRAALLCREANWKACHRQFLADVLAAWGFEVVHLSKRGEEGHVLTPCASYLKNAPPVELVERARGDFAEACKTADAVYLYGGVLDGEGEDVDVAIYGEGLAPEGYDVVRLRPEHTLFQLYVTKAGILLCGRAVVFKEEEVFAEELSLVEFRAKLFNSSKSPVAVCKSLKELLFLAAALKCGVEKTATWRRMRECLRSAGIEPPAQFKHCLNPPPLDELTRVGREALVLALTAIENARTQFQ